MCVYNIQPKLFLRKYVGACWSKLCHSRSNSSSSNSTSFCLLRVYSC